MTLSQRLYQDRYWDESDFEKLLTFFKKYSDCVDEVALMSETTMNAFYPMEEFEKTLPVLIDRIKRLRACGIPSVGINVLCTMGHHGEATRYSDDGRFQPLVNYDGAKAKGCYCPNDPAFMAHIRRKYTLVANADPDFIWLDDDLRMQMHDAALFPCFCPNCMRIFNEKNGLALTREELVKLLNAPEGAELRKKWIEQNEDTLDFLCANIEQAVHGVQPRIELGFMHCNDGMSTYSGDGYRRWLTTLKCHKTRPGGGLYSDRMPLSYIEKAMECARSRSRYADIVTDLQYEFEQFTYQKYIKSCYMANIECMTVVANGFNGVAFDALKLEPGGSLVDWEPFMGMIRANRKLWQSMTELSAGYHNEGANPLLPLNYEKCRSVDEKGWFVLPGKPEGYGNYAEIMHVSHTATLHSYVYNEIGIPMTMEEGRQAVTILEGHMPEALSDEELKALFAHGVFLDGVALGCLEKRGMAHLCGVRAGESYSNNIMERLTDDPMNGEYAGEIRDPRLSLMHANCNVLIPKGENLHALCELIDMNRDPLGPAHTLYENELGGRVAVITPSPYHLMLSSAKIHQIRETFDWLGGGSMPLRMQSISRVIPTIRVSEDRRHFLMLLVNGSMDAAENVRMEVRLPVTGEWYALDAEGNRVPLPAECLERTAAGWELNLGTLEKWEYRVIGA